MAPRRLRCREILAALKRLGVIEARQEGAHIILLKPIAPGSKKGPTYPLTCHSPGHEHPPSVIRAICTAFKIPEDKFWNEV